MSATIAVDIAATGDGPGCVEAPGTQRLWRRLLLLAGVVAGLWMIGLLAHGASASAQSTARTSARDGGAVTVSDVTRTLDQLTRGVGLPAPSHALRTTTAHHRSAGHHAAATHRAENRAHRSSAPTAHRTSHSTAATRSTASTQTGALRGRATALPAVASIVRAAALDGVPAVVDVLVPTGHAVATTVALTADDVVTSTVQLAGTVSGPVLGTVVGITGTSGGGLGDLPPVTLPTVPLPVPSGLTGTSAGTSGATRTPAPVRLPAGPARGMPSHHRLADTARSEGGSASGPARMIGGGPACSAVARRSHAPAPAPSRNPFPLPAAPTGDTGTAANSAPADNGTGGWAPGTARTAAGDQLVTHALRNGSAGSSGAPAPRPTFSPD